MARANRANAMLVNRRLCLYIYYIAWPSTMLGPCWHGEQEYMIELPG